MKSGGSASWKLFDTHGMPAGFIAWSPERGFRFQVGQNLEKLLRQFTADSLSMAPEHATREIVADLLECVLPFVSQGAVRAVPTGDNLLPATGPAWTPPAAAGRPRKLWWIVAVVGVVVGLILWSAQQ